MPLLRARVHASTPLLAFVPMLAECAWLPEQLDQMLVQQWEKSKSTYNELGKTLPESRYST